MEKEIDKAVILDTLIEKIKKDYSDDISIVFVYGSCLTNDFHSLSDIDLFIVLNSDRGKKLGFTFILNGIGYDFWTVSWEWVKSVANYETRSPSLITEGKIYYYRSENDLAMFKKFQEIAVSANREKYKKKAREKMKDIYETVFMINNSGKISEMRNEIIGFVYGISEVLSLINCRNTKRKRKYVKNEIMEMENIPDNFADNYDLLFTCGNCNEIRNAVNYLAGETKKIVDRQTKTNEPISFKQAFAGWYEEMIQHYNKIFHACNTNDYYTALFAAVELTYELENNFNRIGIQPVLPDIIREYDPHDLEKLSLITLEHQKKLERLLAENNIIIQKFSSIEGFKEHIKKL